MWIYGFSNELYHHGVKGMKWGVRKSPSSSGSKTLKKNSRKMTDDQKKKASMKKAVKNRRTLSDADLKKRIERIKLEKQLKDITSEELTPGRKAVKDILSSSGKKVASTAITGAALYGIKVALTKKFDPKEAAGYIAPKPKNK